LELAFQRARSEHRPLFVVFRCLPCKQCSDFDRDVLEGGPELDPLLREFVTVRLTDVRNVDLRLFPMEDFQDFDLSWWGRFLSPEGEVYGVFGGRDHVSDSTRISVPALTATLGRVLAHHRDPARGSKPVDRTGPPRTPPDLPGFGSWARAGAPEAREGCLHCHQVAEILRQPAIDAGTFDKRKDLSMWPLPESAGIELERDHGLRVAAVQPGSSAARADLRPGDILDSADGRRLFSQADFRGVLHRGPSGRGEIELSWHRGGQVHDSRLHLEEGWRSRWDSSEIAWRMSVSQGNIGGNPGFWPLRAREDLARKLALPPGRLAVQPYYGKAKDVPARKAGLEEDLVVTAVNGQSPDLHGREFLTWFRLAFNPGDPVTFTVRDHRGREREIAHAAE
jgi:hypothetical protein